MGQAFLPAEAAVVEMFAPVPAECAPGEFGLNRRSHWPTSLRFAGQWHPANLRQAVKPDLRVRDLLN